MWSSGKRGGNDSVLEMISMPLFYRPSIFHLYYIFHLSVTKREGSVIVVYNRKFSSLIINGVRNRKLQ